MTTQLPLAPLLHNELNRRADRAIETLGFSAMWCLSMDVPLGQSERSVADEYRSYHEAAMARMPERGAFQ